MNKIKKGDRIIVIAGKDKNKKSVVLNVLGEKLLVKDVNLVKKHQKPSRNEKGENIAGGIMSQERPINRSNVMLLDHQDTPSRAGIRVLESGEKIRFFKSSGEDIIQPVQSETRQQA